jgi:hypothetical protein
MKEFYRQETTRILAIQKYLSTAEITTTAAAATPFTAKELTVGTIMKLGQQQGFSAVRFVENCG